MGKYCGNCGAAANDNDRICGNCGAPLPVDGAPGANSAALLNNKKKKLSGKTTGILAAVVVVVIAVAVTLALTLGGKDKDQYETDISYQATTYQDAIKLFFEAWEEGDAKKIGGVAYLKGEDDSQLKVLNMPLQSIDYTIVRDEEMDQEELEAMKEEAMEAGYPDIDKIAQAREVDVEAVFTSNGYQEETDAGLIVLKIGDHWKVFIADL